MREIPRAELRYRPQMGDETEATGDRGLYVRMAVFLAIAGLILLIVLLPQSCKTRSGERSDAEKALTAADDGGRRSSEIASAGFHCFTDLEDNQSACFRAEMACDELRGIMFNDGSSVSRCGHRARAFCFFLEKADAGVGDAWCTVTLDECIAERKRVEGSTGCEERE